MDYHDVVSAVWTLILTAPIHCRGSIGDLMLNFSKSVLSKKQTYLGWPEAEYIELKNIFL